MTREEIERMSEEARVHEAEDQQRRAEVETRNQADSLVYNTEKLLEDNADKVPEELKTEVEGKIATLKTAIDNNNVAEMQTATTDLNTVIQRLGEAVYAQTPGDTGVPSEDPTVPAEEPPKDDTVEGEFREV